MEWKNLQTWLKGLIVGGISGIAVYGVFFIVYALGAVLDIGSYTGNSIKSFAGFMLSIPLFFIGKNINTISILNSPISSETALFLGWFILGALIGLIIGLIKKRN